MMRSFLTRFPNSLTGVVLLVPCLLICLACSTPGAKFELTSPRPGHADVYVYRTSDISMQHDWGEIISLDDEEVGTLRSTGLPGDVPGCQYLLISVSPGDHRLQARSRFPFEVEHLKLRELAVTAEPDRVYFVRVHRALLDTFIVWPSLLFEWGKQLRQSTGDEPPPDITECFRYARLDAPAPPGGLLGPA